MHACLPCLARRRGAAEVVCTDQFTSESARMARQTGTYLSSCRGRQDGNGDHQPQPLQHRSHCVGLSGA